MTKQAARISYVTAARLNSAFLAWNSLLFALKQAHTLYPAKMVWPLGKLPFHPGKNKIMKCKVFWHASKAKKVFVEYCSSNAAPMDLNWFKRKAQ